MSNKQMNFAQVGPKGASWYKQDSFKKAELVTDRSSNKDLAIEDIRFFQPKGESNRVVASAVIEFTNGLTVFGTVYKAKDGENLTFGVEQRPFKKNGQQRYVDINVKVPLPVQAQVLRHAETRMIQVPAEPPVQNNGPADTQDNAQQEDIQQEQDLEGFSNEELMNIINNR